MVAELVIAPPCTHDRSRRWDNYGRLLETRKKQRKIFVSNLIHEHCVQTQIYGKTQTVFIGAENSYGCYTAKKTLQFKVGG